VVEEPGVLAVEAGAEAFCVEVELGAGLLDGFNAAGLDGWGGCAEGGGTGGRVGAAAGGAAEGLDPPMFKEIVGAGGGASDCGGRSMGIWEGA